MIHALTIFLSAFLLFVVQLILGKFILPWFGGSPAVWSTCMLFFQVLLLLGYAYAHLISRRLSPSGQAMLHAGLVAASVVVLGILAWRWGSPLLPAENWKLRQPGQPVAQILKALTIMAGIPFFVLSATSPLLQRWHSLKAEGERSYRLYALSNLGSMLGLVSYPFLVEPAASLRGQAWFWGGLYGLFAVGCTACALKLFGRRNPGPVRAEEVEFGRPAGPRPGWVTVGLWLLLTTITSAMLLSVTNSLCQEVAVVPFLWALPLALYLLSFIICFDSPRWYRRRVFVAGSAVASLVVLITAFQGVRLDIPAHILSYGAFLFLFCMTCHGELARLKPATPHLTLFYLTVALGGALGGIFVGLIAPVIFQSFWEFHVTMMAGWILLAVVFARDKTSFFFTGDGWHFYLLVLLASYILARLVLLLSPAHQVEFLSSNLMTSTLFLALFMTGGVGLLMRQARTVQSRYWPRILVGAVIFLAECFMLNRIRSTGLLSLDVERNFYGVVRVLRPGPLSAKQPAFIQLAHGQINHGVQYLDDPWRRQPVGYFSASSGIALALREHSRRTGRSGEGMNIGVLGLGVGTLAAFAHAGDTIRFYEINPAVVRYSSGPKPHFTYLKDCPGTVDVVLGDARLSLERDLDRPEPGRFDVLVMDAFSSDAIPVHLLTVEAFQTYLRHLRDDESIIAVNISNRFLDLRDLMFTVADHFGLGIVLVETVGDQPMPTPSRWCLLTRSRSFLDRGAVQQARRPYARRKSVLWTDQFSNLFQLLDGSGQAARGRPVP